MSAVVSITAAAAFPRVAHAQQGQEGSAVVPVRSPSVRIILRGHPTADSTTVRADTTADIEIITIPTTAISARYSPWRGCGPIIVRTRPRPLPEESLRWLRLDLPHPEPPQNWLLQLSGAMFMEVITSDLLEVQLPRRASARL